MLANKRSTKTLTNQNESERMIVKSKWSIVGVVLVILAVLAASGCSLLQEPEEASEPIVAAPIDEDETGDPTESAGEAARLQIEQGESEARFLIGEILRGQENTVVGATDQVAAEIAVDFDNPAASQLGEVRVNARTFVTDNSLRNRAIANRILDAGSFEFVTFSPTNISGLPESVTFGDSFEVQIVGDLTIKDITNEVTFEATITPVSEERLEGFASTTISWADFGLSIPNVPQVAGVDEELTLEIEFVAG